MRESHLALQLLESERVPLPAVLLSPATQILLQDVFEDCGLLEGFPVIRKRVVLWGTDAQRVELPHSGIVVPESRLLDRLWPRIRLQWQGEIDRSADWRVFCSRASSSEGELHAFGSRIAAASQVQLSPQADSEACWVESVDSGWLFLLPNGSRAATLIGVGGELGMLLDNSRLIARQISAVDGANAAFPAYPRIRAPLCDVGWLACGSAAMGFDPICGEGAGHAVREAILVSAVLRAIAAEARPAELLAHYSSRLLAGFLRHLEICRQFYTAASCGEWWQSEIALLEKGIEWTRGQLPPHPPTQFRLVGFDLEAVSD
jgi:hypothetical protein